MGRRPSMFQYCLNIGNYDSNLISSSGNLTKYSEYWFDVMLRDNRSPNLGQIVYER